MFNEISLTDAVEFIVDNRGKTVPVQDSGFPLIATNCISNENLYPEFKNVRYVSDEVYKNWFRAHPEPNDIILTNKGSKNGAICLVPDPVSFCIAQDMVALRAKKDLVYPRYLFAVLRSSLVQNRIKELNVDSVIPHFKKTDFNKLFFPLPDYDRQIVIGDCYFNYCQKIENNIQTNQTLEQIAQAIFKSWFVDFVPVKAKIKTLAAGGSADDAELAAMSAISAKTVDELNSLKASNLEVFNKLAQTAALIPAAIQDSELGEIPEGWEVSDLASCTTELRRGISPKYIEEGGVLVINQKCIRSHSINFSLARRNDSSKRKVDGREIAIGDVLVNSTGVGTLGRLSPVRFLNETTVVDSHVTVVRANTAKISKSFLSGLMLTNEAYIEASGAGSTGQTELRKQVLEDIKFTKPLKVLDKLFDEIIGKFNVQVAELEKQSATLSLTRDALLPKLLSGELGGE